MEIWKQTTRYPKYEVSTEGRIRRLGHSKVRKLWVHQCGYPMINLLNKDGKKLPIRIHRLVAETFLGSTEGKVVDHINRIRSDNRLENLRIMTQQENMANVGMEWRDITTISKVIRLYQSGLTPEQICLLFQINNL